MKASKHNKQKKPAELDNSWLGNTGSKAVAYDKNGVVVLTTLDAPNPVAYAVQRYPQIVRVSGILGDYNISKMRARCISKEFKSTYQSYIELK